MGAAGSVTVSDTLELDPIRLFAVRLTVTVDPPVKPVMTQEVSVGAAGVQDGFRV